MNPLASTAIRQLVWSSDVCFQLAGLAGLAAALLSAAASLQRRRQPLTVASLSGFAAALAATGLVCGFAAVQLHRRARRPPPN